MTIFINYINVIGDLLSASVLFDNCYVSEPKYDGSRLLVFKVGSDIVDAFRISSIVSLSF